MESTYNEVKLYIKDKGFVDINNTYPISLNFRVQDIADISKRGGSYSKTINVPGTKTNNQLFSQLFNIRSSDFSFDLNKKYDVILYSNGLVVFEGYIQLLEVVKSPNGSAWDENDVVSFNINLFNASINFFTSISDKYLDNIDFNVPSHYLTRNNILATSGNTYLNTFKYIQLYSENKDANYYPTDFWPAIYATAYVDRIIQDAGFYYNNDYLSVGDYAKFIIPYTGKDFKKDLAVQNAERAFIGFSGTVNNNNNWVVTPGNLGNVTDKRFLFNKISPVADYAFFQNQNGYPTGARPWEYICKTGGKKSFTLNIDMEADFVAKKTTRWATESTGYTQTTFADRARLYIHVFKNGVKVKSVYPQNFTFRWVSSGVNIVIYYTAKQNILISGIETMVGDVLDLRYSFWVDDPSKVGSTYDSGYFNYTSISNTHLKWNGMTTSTYFQEEAFRWEGDLIELNDFIPKNIKQKDFLGNYLKTLNLIMDTDKDDSKKFIIKTRDDYYNTTVYKDWTSKLDRSQEITLKYLSELQNKEILFSYKDSSDQWSSEYKKNFNQSFGRKLITFNNELLVGQDIKESLFTTTPNVWCGNLVVPAINGKLPDGLKMLYDGGMETGSWTFKSSATTVDMQMSTYAYAGHLDNPAEPTFDLNFDVAEAYFVQPLYYTQNNLYNLYHSNTVKQIAEGRQMTAYFLLNESDISDLVLSDKIIVDNVIYVVNEIKDFNPTDRRALTKVVLNTWEDIYSMAPPKVAKQVWTGRTVPNIIRYRPAPYFGSAQQYISPTSLSTFVDGSENAIGDYSRNSIIIGSYNSIGSSTNRVGIVSSDYSSASDASQDVQLFASNNVSVGFGAKSINTFASSDISVSENTENISLLSSKNVTIMSGTSNINLFSAKDTVVSPGATNITLIGTSGITLTESDSNKTFIYGDQVIFGGGIGEISQGLKKNLHPTDAITVKEDYQYHIYNDFTVSGSATANGQILIENGDLNLFGDITIGANGDLTILDEASGSTGSGGVSIHNLLSGIQGGQSSEYYHLTSAEYTALQSGFTAGVDTSVLYNNNGVLSGDTNLAYDYDNIRFRLGVKKDSINSNALALTDSTVNAYGLFLGNATSAGFTSSVKGVGYDDNDVGLLLAGQLASTASTGNGLQLRSSLSGSTIGDSQKLLQIQNYNTQKLTMLGNGNILFGYNSSFAATPELPFHFYPGSGAQGMPATSGTSQTGVIRVGGVGTSGIMDIGNYGGNGSWFQATNRTNLSLNYPIYLNPNGGNIGVGTTATTASLHVHKPTNANNYIKISNSDTGAAIGDGFDIGITTTEKAIVWNYEPTTLALATNNTERVTILSGGSVGINTITPDATLQVSGSTKLGNSTGYTQVDSDGHMTMVGSATYWDDLRVEPIVRGTGLQNPSFERYFRNSGATTNGVYLYSFGDVILAQEKEVFFNVQLNHGWAGTPIRFHTHWIPSVSATTATGSIIWGLEYTWAGIGNDFGNTNTIYSDGLNYVSGGTQSGMTSGRHYLSLFPEITPNAAQHYLSSVLICRLFRYSSSSADTYTNKVGLLYADFHVENNALGSNTEYSK